MKVAVIMPLFNTNGKWIKESVESILIAMDYFKKERNGIAKLFIGNDGSTNKDTLEVLDYYKTNPNIEIINNRKNLGCPNTINKLIYKCTDGYEFICYIDSDDIMMFNRIVIQYDLMNDPENKDVTILGTNTQNLINWHNKVRIIRELYYKSYKTNDIDILYHNPFCHPTIFYRRKDIVDNKIKYNIKDKYSSDYDFYCQILSHGLYGKFIPDALTYYRQSPNMISRKYEKEITDNLGKYKEKYNISDLYRLNFKNEIIKLSKVYE